MLVPVTVREVMNPDVETASPDTPVVAVAERLHTAGIGSVVVCEDGGPLGIVTESDMVALVATRRTGEELTAADCMAAPAVTVPQDAPIERAVELFREHEVKKLPVTSDGAVVGIITTTDVSNYLPHLLRGTTPTRPDVARHDRGRVDTAYENEDWTFESLGERDDHIELGDVVKLSKELSAADVEAFAEASGDTNRLHLDADYAAGSRFGRRIVHGTLVTGTISAAVARLPGLIVYLSQDTSYLGPVDIGERVTAVGEVVEDLGNDRYRLTTTVQDEDGEEVVDGEAVVVADPIPESA